MKNKGQALVIFIILIPVFLVITGILVDMGINSYNDKKFNNISKDIMNSLLDNEYLETVSYETEEEVIGKLKDQAIMLYDANELKTTDLVISINYGKEVTLFNTYEHYSFINSLFGRGNGMRQINIELTGKIENGEKIIEFKDGSNEG